MWSLCTNRSGTEETIKIEKGSNMKLILGPREGGRVALEISGTLGPLTMLEWFAVVHPFQGLPIKNALSD